MSAVSSVLGSSESPSRLFVSRDVLAFSLGIDDRQNPGAENESVQGLGGNSLSLGV